MIVQMPLHPCFYCRKLACAAFYLYCSGWCREMQQRVLAEWYAPERR